MAVGGACVYEDECIWWQDVRSPFYSNRRGELGRGFGEEGEDGEEAECLVYNGRDEGVFEEGVVGCVG